MLGFHRLLKSLGSVLWIGPDTLSGLEVDGSEAGSPELYLPLALQTQGSPTCSESHTVQTLDSFSHPGLTGSCWPILRKSFQNKTNVTVVDEEEIPGKGQPSQPPGLEMA